MNRVIQTSEVLGSVELPEGAREVCASADAGYDETDGRLVVELTAFLRPTGLQVKEQSLRADWLPADETVTESVARNECHDVAREIFHRWVRQVRKAAPRLHSA